LKRTAPRPRSATAPAPIAIGVTVYFSSFVSVSSIGALITSASAILESYAVTSASTGPLL